MAEHFFVYVLDRLDNANGSILSHTGIINVEFWFDKAHENKIEHCYVMPSVCFIFSMINYNTFTKFSLSIDQCETQDWEL